MREIRNRENRGGKNSSKEMYPTESSIKINFGNYSGKGSLWSLIGSPKDMWVVNKEEN